MHDAIVCVDDRTAVVSCDFNSKFFHNLGKRKLEMGRNFYLSIDGSLKHYEDYKKFFQELIQFCDYYIRVSLDFGTLFNFRIQSAFFC